MNASVETECRRHPLAMALAFSLVPLLLATAPRVQAEQTTQETEVMQSVERGSPQQSVPPTVEHAADAIDHARDGLPAPPQQGEDPMTSRQPPVQAQGTAATPEPAPGMRLWTQLDRDRDGRISATEGRADADFSTRFASLDADHDGFVSEVEYRAQGKDQDQP